MSRSWDHKLLIMCPVLPYLLCYFWNNACIILVCFFVYCRASKPIRISRLVTRGEGGKVNEIILS